MIIGSVKKKKKHQTLDIQPSLCIYHFNGNSRIITRKHPLSPNITFRLPRAYGLGFEALGLYGVRVRNDLGNDAQVPYLSFSSERQNDPLFSVLWEFCGQDEVLGRTMWSVFFWKLCVDHSTNMVLPCPSHMKPLGFTHHIFQGTPPLSQTGSMWPADLIHMDIWPEMMYIKSCTVYICIDIYIYILLLLLLSVLLLLLLLSLSCINEQWYLQFVNNVCIYIILYSYICNHKYIYICIHISSTQFYQISSILFTLQIQKKEIGERINQRGPPRDHLEGFCHEFADLKLRRWSAKGPLWQTMAKPWQTKTVNTCCLWWMLEDTYWLVVGEKPLWNIWWTSSIGMMTFQPNIFMGK